MQSKNPYNGIVNIYKEKGFTSFDVVTKLRGIFGMKKIGHTGTLDPLAEGVLPCVLGGATKLVPMLTDKDKEYVVDFVLGISTDTYDMTGEILEKREALVSPNEVRASINRFIGTLNQLPPMYSAIKINGQRLYELARQGKEVQRKERQISIYSIDILSMSLPHIKARVHCSKGTYIRSLVHDIGDALGTGAAMEGLIRTKSGIFTLEKALGLAELQALKDEGNLLKAIYPLDEVFKEYPVFCPGREQERLIANGNKIRIKPAMLPDKPKGIRIYTTGRELVAIYSLAKSGRDYLEYAPEYMFITGNQ